MGSTEMIQLLSNFTKIKIKNLKNVVPKIYFSRSQFFSSTYQYFQIYNKKLNFAQNYFSNAMILRFYVLRTIDHYHVPIGNGR